MLNNKSPGRFITLEGSEGAGKTTALKLICQILDSWGVEYICTREPGGEPTAEKIREILLHSEHLHAKTELLLMFAARNEHIENVIKPALTKGIWVVSDRFVDASYAYQGGGRQLGFDTVKWMDTFIVADIQADFTLLMDIEPEIGLSRISSRGQADRIEQEGIAFFHRITKAYREKARSNAERYAVIDASQPIEQVVQLIKQAFSDRKGSLL
ncbi:MAG TPA: dTMP kinase [Oceanospirillales bacterium]|nr:dTMP kinase [Oceanospirillales bacterium]